MTTSLEMVVAPNYKCDNWCLYVINLLVITTTFQLQIAFWFLVELALSSLMLSADFLGLIPAFYMVVQQLVCG